MIAAPTPHRYYLDDLFPSGEAAQVPYLYSPAFAAKLDQIRALGRRGITPSGRVYYEVTER